MPHGAFPLKGLALTLACLLPLAGQSNAATKSFEVASVKAVVPLVAGDGHNFHNVSGPRFGPGTADATRWACDACSLALLVSEAYELKRFQIAGPKWLDSERFDIIARVPEGSTVADLRLMLQNLLAERFGLKAHIDQKEMQVFELMLAKGGPKLKPAAANAAGAIAGVAGSHDDHGGPSAGPATGRAFGNWAGHSTGQTSTFTMHGNMRHNAVAEDMPTLAGFLATQLDRPVVDSTGLSGKYDFLLNFSGGKQAEAVAIPHGGDGAPAAGHADGPDSEAPPLPKALQDQLGLRLEAKKGTTGLLVIERIEKAPTAN